MFIASQSTSEFIECLAGPQWRRPGPQPQALLTSCERRTLELVARGFGYAEIARLQGVSRHTTHSHIKSIYGKLEVHSKNEAVYEAMALGLLQPALGTRSDHVRAAFGDSGSDQQTKASAA
jgi:DNA-binding CsgD family transcriptional regulator